MCENYDVKAEYTKVNHALLKATIRWRERLYQHAQGNAPIAPWEHLDYHS